MQLVKLITVFSPSFALLLSMSCSLSSGNVDGAVYNKSQDNCSLTSMTEQLPISRQREANMQIASQDLYHRASDYANICYGEHFPFMHASAENRTVSWDEARLDVDGGKKCCSSLAEVRQGIDAVDEQLLLLLAKRLVKQLNINSYVLTPGILTDTYRFPGLEPLMSARPLVSKLPMTQWTSHLEVER